MNIYEKTGVTKSGEIFLNKGIGALVIATDNEFSELTNETISIWIQKETGNLDLANDVLLKDFMILGSYGEDSIHALGTFKASAYCELTEDGGYIGLLENEVIKFSLNNLKSGKTYALFGIEEPVQAKEVLMYERKTMSSEVLNQDFDVKGYDVLSLEHKDSINEISFTYDNHAVVKYLPIELEALERSLDPIQVIKSDNTLAFIENRYQLQLKGIVSINIRKSPGDMLNMHLRIDQEDKRMYQSNK